MDLDSLNFYISALSAHRKAGKQDSAFLEKLKNLYLLDQITEEVYEMLVEIIKKAGGKGKKATSTSKANPSPSSYTSVSDGSCESSSRSRGCGDPEPRKPPTGSCGNHQSSSSNGRC